MRFKDGKAYQFSKDVDGMQKRLDRIAKGSGEGDSTEGGGTSKMYSLIHQPQAHERIGLADKHFKPIEIEAKKIKEQ